MAKRVQHPVTLSLTYPSQHYPAWDTIAETIVGGKADGKGIFFDNTGKGKSIRDMEWYNMSVNRGAPPSQSPYLTWFQGKRKVIRVCRKDKDQMNTVPNLDCMSHDELMTFWKSYHRPSRKTAETLIGDRRKGFTILCGLLAAYACNKACALRLRVEGKIDDATIYELICDNVYEKLPKDIRW